MAKKKPPKTFLNLLEGAVPIDIEMQQEQKEEKQQTENDAPEIIPQENQEMAADNQSDQTLETTEKPDVKQQSEEDHNQLPQNNKPTPPAPVEKEVAADEEMSLDEFVKTKIKEYEKVVQAESNVLNFKAGEKVKFDDKRPVFSTPLRNELQEIIKELYARSSRRKYQVAELIIYNGLKYTKWD